MIQARECGNWTILSLLGEGGMGEVFLARHKYLGTPGAVKGLSLFLTRDEKFRDRFLQEAQMQAQLRHPHIAPVLDYIVEHDQSYLVIEYLSGGSFADLIERSNSPLDQGQALTWIRQALAALDYAHQRGVIHRDIKPSNIMLDEHGNAKVVDFGIALVMGGRRLTATGQSIGTPEYMSPEQIVRPKTVDHRTDVYSMGIVLYEMLSGRVPFEGDTDFTIKAAQVNEPPTSLRSLNGAIPAELERMVMRALAKDPDDRYAGCGEFVKAIEAYQSRKSAAPPQSIAATCGQCGATVRLTLPEKKDAPQKEGYTAGDSVASFIDNALLSIGSSPPLTQTVQKPPAAAKAAIGAVPGISKKERLFQIFLYLLLLGLIILLAARR